MKIKQIIMILLCFSNFTFTTNASATINNETNKLPNFPPKKNSVNYRYLSYFITELYHEEIIEAIEDYYKNKEIEASGNAPPSDEHNYGMISIYLWNDYSDIFSYMLKNFIITYDT